MTGRYDSGSDQEEMERTPVHDIETIPFHLKGSVSRYNFSTLSCAPNYSYFVEKSPHLCLLWSSWKEV